MTKISHISWGDYDKGFYGIRFFAIAKSLNKIIKISTKNSLLDHLKEVSFTMIIILIEAYFRDEELLFISFFIRNLLL